MPVLDRNTGLPMNPSLTSNIAFTQTGSQTGSQTTGPSTSVATTTGTDRTTSSVSNVSSSLNTTPQALAALNMLITQLSDRPNISEAQLNEQYPLAQRQFHPNMGWRYIDPRTGNPMDDVQADRFNARQQASRAEATRNAGTTPGGTSETRQQQAERQTEISRNRSEQNRYSAGAAREDAQALINKSIADALEAAMPQISAGLEGAGTSRSTIAASLTQRAATRGATEGAALGANLGVQYGQLSNQLSGVLEQLTRSDPNGPTAMLLNAINTSRGLVSTTTQNQTGGSVTNRTGTTTTQNTGGTTNTTQDTSVNRNPLIPGAMASTQVANVMSGQPAAANSNPYYSFSAGNAMNDAYGDVFSSGTTDQFFGNNALEEY